MLRYLERFVFILKFTSSLAVLRNCGKIIFHSSYSNIGFNALNRSSAKAYKKQKYIRKLMKKQIQSYKKCPQFHCIKRNDM